MNTLTKEFLKFNYSKKIMKIPTVIKFKDNYWAVGYEGEYRDYVKDHDTVLLIINNMLSNQDINCGYFGFSPNHDGIIHINKTLSEYFKEV
jgi:hypothetical protein